MKKHPVCVEGYNGTLRDLAEAIAKMRYDKIVEFLKYLAMEFFIQAENDQKNKKIKLANLLMKIFLKIEELYKQMDEVVFLCRSYIEKEKEGKDIC